MEPQGGRAGDEIDRARARVAWTALAGVVASGIGAMLGITYLESCRGCDDLDALPLIGIVPTWAAAMAMTAGRWAWTRRFGSGVAGAFLLAWIALHYVVPGLVALYAPVHSFLRVLGWAFGFLLFWLLTTGAMVATVLLGERAAERIAR